MALITAQEIMPIAFEWWLCSTRAISIVAEHGSAEISVEPLPTKKGMIV
ncbi:hypothetical protein [Rhizobium leguminosarum]|nr:hypothetical protein [Rhizobium leguminosarum]